MALGWSTRRWTAPGRLAFVVLLQASCVLSFEATEGVYAPATPAPPTIAPPATSAPTGALATPVGSEFGAGQTQPLGGGFQRESTSLTMMMFLILGTLLICAMWAINRRVNKTAEMWENDLRVLKDTDQYVLNILRKFSSLSVDEHVFRGIKKKKQMVSMEFTDISCFVRAPNIPLPGFPAPEKKTILKGVSGRFHSGRIAAIMGPSGAGKTTFLNVVSGKAQAAGGFEVGGTIHINGTKSDVSSMKNVVGFVPQDDIVHEKMTVRENILFSAALRNERGSSKKHLLKITNDVLQVLQLEPQQSKLVGNRSTGTGLSGGQRKRVNVGLELAACPSLLFLDEPTSGLDATSSLLLVRQLQKMTQLGMTIVMVIHQPRFSLFTLIDDVLLLGKGGRTVYVGPTGRATQYFESHGFSMPRNENPADWLMDIISGQVEILNPRIPKEELPEKLFDLWDSAQHSYNRATTADLEADMSGHQSPSRRRLTPEEDWTLVKSHIKDAWSQLDPPMTGQLSKEEFREVLTNCTGQEPDAIIVEELIDRVTQRPGSCITHQQFIRYLHCLHGSIAGSLFGGHPMPPDISSANLMGVPEDGSSMSEFCDSGSESTTDDESDEESPTLRAESLYRRLPGVWPQFTILLRRRTLQWWRRMPVRVLFLIIVEFAAAFLGLMDHFVFRTAPFSPSGLVNAQISLGLLTSVYCLNTFSEDPPVYWREASHGLNRWAFFWARHTVDMIDVVMMCLGFTTMYMVITQPLLMYYYYVWPFILVSWVTAGWGYLISTVLPFEYLTLGPFISALLSFVTGGILGLPQQMAVYLNGSFYELIVSVGSWTRWATAMGFLKYIQLFPPDLDGMSQKERFEFQMYESAYKQSTWYFPGDNTSWWTGTFALMVMGFVLRIGAYCGLRFANRGKQV